ncbi:hypothetical protein [Nonomuraea sp. NPDC049709]|uniref:hypothetical protein n=1 Tax=Nonomuraea sp. NPDC049709 TaxID=3154736 RepID=UPI0034484EA6
MHRPVRLLAATALASLGLLAAAPIANAVVDPARAGQCLAASAGELTTIVDPTAAGMPAEVPAMHCITTP